MFESKFTAIIEFSHLEWVKTSTGWLSIHSLRTFSAGMPFSFQFEDRLPSYRPSAGIYSSASYYSSLWTTTPTLAGSTGTSSGSGSGDLGGDGFAASNIFTGEACPEKSSISS
jgi:hypothetical protein